MFHRPSIRSTLTTVAAAAVLVGGADLASYAATGNPLTLGHSNSANRTTGLTNTGSGPALNLKSSTNSPSLQLNSTKLVKHLNADRLDGLDSTQVKNAAYRYAIPSTGALTTQAVLSFPGLPTGKWMASYSLVAFPTSTVQCFFRQASPTTGEAYSFTPAGSIAGLNASAVIDTTGTHGPVKLYCQGSNYVLYSSAGDVESTVTFTNLTSVTNSTITQSRTAAKSSGRLTGTR